MDIIFVLIAFCVFKNAEQAPLQETPPFEFDDGWNYKLPPHTSPLLKGSEKHFLKPHYTYGKDLKVEGLNDNDDRNSKATEFRKIIAFGSDSRDIIGLNVTCPVCETAAQFLKNQLTAGVPFDMIKQYFVLICAGFTDMEVCSGLFDSYGPELLPVLAIISDARDACKLLLGESCENSETPNHEWTVELPDNKPEIKEPQLPKAGKPVFKVLQLSDTHYDPDYVVGSVVNCQEPLCCRSHSTPKEDEERISAGRWGSYQKCDAPRSLLENMLNHIALEHPDVDYIIWTGDLPPHDVWKQTKQSNLDVIKDSVEMIFKMFPDKPVFPAIGNHESAPAGNFPPPWMQDESHSISWLYEELANHWLKWLPSSTGNTLQHGAFYSVLLRPGFRLISLNTNYCYSLSWWLFVNGTDPASELKWLVNELQLAENNNEKVHIIGHVAPGSEDCLKAWSRNFHDIVNRYESTITGLFYGHSHADEFEVFYDKKNRSRPTAVAYLGPSVTSFTNYNPAYRIYYVDGDHNESTREILDHETWTMDLADANENENPPNWFRLYSAKEAYEMPNLRPKYWDKLIKDMEQNSNLFQQFYRNYYRQSPTTPWCDAECKHKIICDLKCAKSQSRHELCEQISR